MASWFLFLLGLFLALASLALASDPMSLQDFCVADANAAGTSSCLLNISPFFFLSPSLAYHKPMKKF